MNYGYIRVSSVGQKIDRQMDDMEKLGLSKTQIFIDKQSGKDFERKNYQKLRKKLKKDDLLYIKSIDRLGRNYTMIIEEWHYITKIICANIHVIDMPLLDTRSDNNLLVGKFISDIVLQILSFVAETERINTKTRQAEGIKLAKEKGVKFGRPEKKLPENFKEIAVKFINREMKMIEASEYLGMCKTTFLKNVQKLKDKL